MTQLSRISFALLLSVVFAATGCRGGSAEAAAESNEPPPISVQTEPVTVLDVPRTLRLTGTLRGNREADLAANANGRVIAVEVERGQQIKRVRCEPSWTCVLSRCLLQRPERKSTAPALKKSKPAESATATSSSKPKVQSAIWNTSRRSRSAARYRSPCRLLLRARRLPHKTSATA